jgi:hypothetical protein
VLSSVTPAWDWIAVHAVRAVGRSGRPQSVIAFAGRGARCTPGFRVARVSAAGTPGDVFTTSALTWGHSVLASVQYSNARRAFNDAITACAEAVTPAAFADLADPPGPLASARAATASPADERQAGTAGHPPGRPAGRWPVAEAGVLLDEMKAKIAEITHPWQLVQAPAPDLGGQHLIGLHAMRHEVAEGSATVHALVSQLAGAATPARPLSW